LNPITIHPSGIEFRPDNRRVVLRSFIPADGTQVGHIIGRALLWNEAEVETQLAAIHKEFLGRHLDIEESCLLHFEKVKAHVPTSHPLSRPRQVLIGALFSGEYSLEAAALFNPSIVPHPDQRGLQKGDLRFIMSLRATGEGHISSIEFRTGVLRKDFSIQMEATSPVVTLPVRNPNPTFTKRIFLHKLREMGLENKCSAQVMNALNETFTMEALERSMQRATPVAAPHSRDFHRTLECMQWLAKSNYEVEFKAATHVSERIIFPVSPNESNGIEDARFVRFIEEDSSVTYYATYTAYNGRVILPQLIETQDFLRFQVRTLNGNAVQNKGMALFPRRIDGRYVMLSRQDDENLFLMTSDNPHFWDDPQMLLRPAEAWESVKIGNCGSPIETKAGWLVLTHGVGAMRKYCLGAMLLDLENPSRVIGRLREPLLKPEGMAREGYVPNVVYSCGALVHAGRLILPYGMSDIASTIVTIALEELLERLQH